MKKNILALLILFVGVNGFCADTSEQYFLNKKPYIHPAIIRDLTAWISDSGDQIVSINLLDTQDSNRYYGEVKISKSDGKSPTVCYDVELEAGAWFCYSYVGMLNSDIYVLQTVESGGGSGRFTDLLLVSFESKKNFRFNKEQKVLLKDKDLYLINRIGGIALGDRFVASELKIEDNKIFIGKDVGWYPQSGGLGGADNITQDQNIVIDVDFDD